jgi:hypothetical protein
MKRFALLAVLVLASCAKREEQQVTPTPADPGPTAATVAPIEQGPASKFKGMPVQKPAHLPQKDPIPAANSAAPSAK